MNKREYLRSLGFTVGERGRFSEEMREALKDYKEPEKPKKPEDLLPVREDGVELYRAITTDGHTINFDFCQTCKKRVKNCFCKDPRPPKWILPELKQWITD